MLPKEWNALLIGANKTPAGYREEDQNEFGGMPLVSMTRSCVYESRYNTPSCCHWTSFNIEPYHDHSCEADENDTATYEHSIAGMFGYGFDCAIYGKSPYIGENTRKVFLKWIGIFKQYRETFLGEFIHIAQPTGYTPDAVMHAAPDAEVPALVIIFNPTKDKTPFFACLPLRYAGFAGNSTALVDGVRVPLDYSGNALLSVTLEPGEVRVIEVRR